MIGLSSLRCLKLSFLSMFTTWRTSTQLNRLSDHRLKPTIRIVVSNPCVCAIPACFWSKVMNVLISASDCDDRLTRTQQEACVTASWPFVPSTTATALAKVTFVNSISLDIIRSLGSYYDIFCCFCNVIPCGCRLLHLLEPFSHAVNVDQFLAQKRIDPVTQFSRCFRGRKDLSTPQTT